MVIVKEGNQWCVKSHKTGRKLGCYPTRPQAEARLKQIKRFQNEFGVKLDEL
jgi:hypothetical protein